MSRFKLFIPLLVFLILAIFFWRGLSLDPTAMPSALIDRPVPAFKLATVKDPQQFYTEQDLKGEVALLNVWATWCVACRVEHPFLVQLAQQGLKIVGINYKDDVAEARVWLQKLADPYVYSVVDADGRLGIDLGVFGAPETYVLDKEGVIRYKHVGVVDAKVWRETIEPIVNSLRQ
ncbi:MAG: DsbE family thiol:disulfide interchange protein [Gammaproteobacteria bacterium]|uniref:DsbE family thiol:disulfide interchange protein n=1 Tax=Pseudomaricurvus alcaniphilus TaxID=1166482 RepID=UPI00140DF240|nr:DsbE family thiol:disulfide interchange protein [Pseudomaricurvus alcaniphilus]MBR9912149.1 DsbE family thiol:disulfide interchange protein [Gammaproteobacteria bacterium]NHN35711.1 DsbE family thiol:disulfide interchange protein [Pseudomaricurvus alcaniphilus]